MTAEQLVTMLNYGAGVLLSLGFDYIPSLNVWYAKQSSIVKRLIMIGLLLVVSFIIVAASCTGLYATVKCDEAGVALIFSAFIQAVIANQATFLITPKTKAVRAAKENG